MLSDTALNRHIDASSWVRRFAPLVPSGATVLDIACGSGRHSRLFLDRSARVTCIDRDLSRVADLAGRAELIAADLETGQPFALAGRGFAAVIVTNYLWRPLMPALVAAVASGGLLLYETFAVGNERYGKPSNPAHLLRPGELLDVVKGELEIVAYETGIAPTKHGSAAVQRICARRGAEPAALPD
jgi:SAM-dependent methyltransferase